jgi:hypothetical protein
MEHPMLGHLEFEHILLQTLGDPEVRIMICTSNAATRVKLEPAPSRPGQRVKRMCLL